MRWKDGRSRFWEKVSKGPGCWIWTGGLIAGTGYGSFHDRRRWSTHRYSWTIHHGPIPIGLCVLHHCDNRACVRPDHLWIGTKSDNTADMLSKGRHIAPDTAGENHGGAKLDNSAVREIRASRAPGIALAAFFGVSPSLVSLVRKGKAWTHID